MWAPLLLLAFPAAIRRSEHDLSQLGLGAGIATSSRTECIFQDCREKNASPQSSLAPPPEGARLAYVSYVGSKEYACAARVWAESVRATGTPHEIAIVHTVPVEQADYPNVTLHKFDAAKTSGNGIYQVTFGKLWAGRLTDYHRVILMDADIAVRGNIDHLFNVDPGDSVAAPVRWRASTAL